MAAVFTCCLGCCGDGGAGHAPLKEMPIVQLDTHHMGTDVVIVKSGRRICGTGACLANAPLHQNKSYFEFKIQSTGGCLLDSCYYTLITHDISCFSTNSNDKQNNLLHKDISKHDDSVLVNILMFVISPLILSVDDSAIIDCQFSDFYHTPPEGFEKILFEQQIF
uniref:SPRY domain containing 7b n=1 Tax=Sinocyclocheilus rhinocerous TaxID=307959 RepID=A0A673GNU6_9TELE